MTGHQPAQELLEVLRRPLADEGFDLEDVEISTAGRRRLVRVLIDREGGVTLDEVSTATTLVGGVLDEQEPLGDSPYTLEVTSPGVDRPLTLPRHWRRNVGRLVVVQLVAGQQTTGRVIAGGDTSATLDVEGTTVEVPYGDVRSAHVEVEFGRAGKNGRARKHPKDPRAGRSSDRTPGGDEGEITADGESPEGGERSGRQRRAKDRTMGRAGRSGQPGPRGRPGRPGKPGKRRQRAEREAAAADAAAADAPANAPANAPVNTDAAAADADAATSHSTDRPADADAATSHSPAASDGSGEYTEAAPTGSVPAAREGADDMDPTGSRSATDGPGDEG